MNAQEARKIAAQKRREPIDHLLAKIKQAAESGEMEVHHYKKLHDEVISELEDLDFKITELPNDPRDQGCTEYKISW